MHTIIAFGAAAVCQWLMITTVVRQQRKNTLSSHRFALILASGWSGSLWSLFFVNLVLGGLVPMPIALIGLGVGIGALNFLMVYPIAYYFHKHAFVHVLHNLDKPK
jgi:hypothetical protein